MKNSKRFSPILFAFLIAPLAFMGATNCGSNSAPTTPPQPDTSLTVSVTGIGSGSVTSNTGGIACTKAGGTCDTLLLAGTSVTLTAVPDPGFFFNGWLGGTCRGTAPCTFDLNQAETVAASFVNIAFYSGRSLDPAQDAPNSQSTTNIWLVNSDGSNPHAVAGLEVLNAASFLPTFSPDGNQIVFVSRRNIDGSPSSNPSNTLNVWVMNADGSDPRPLAGLDVAGVNVSFDNPRWSPEGDRILFTSNRNINGTPTANASNQANVWVVNAGGGNPTAPAGLDVAGVRSIAPDWSPDGSKIAFSSSRNVDLTPTVNPNNQDNIFVMGIDGANLQALTQITVAAGDADRPQWSPDGTRIAFISNRSLGSDQNAAPEASRNIWVMQADGSNHKPLTQETGGVFTTNPQWSPDGAVVLFRSNQDPVNPDTGGSGVSASNIWAVAGDGGQPPFPLTALTSTGHFSAFPYSAPDGGVVIFDSNRNLDPALDGPTHAATNVWIVNPDGSGDFPVTALTQVSCFSAFNLD